MRPYYILIILAIVCAICSDKIGSTAKTNLVLQSGVIGLCLGVGVGTALKDLFSETAILFAGIIGATIGVIAGIIIKQKNKSD